MKNTTTLAEEIFVFWSTTLGCFHSFHCRLGAADGFKKGLHEPYEPQDGPFNIGTPEFDAYYLGEKLALEYLDELGLLER